MQTILLLLSRTRKNCGMPPTQLLIKVQEFRTQLDGTHTADVFSVNMYKQTEDIEKLAKQLKNRARP